MSWICLKVIEWVGWGYRLLKQDWWYIDTFWNYVTSPWASIILFIFNMLENVYNKNSNIKKHTTVLKAVQGLFLISLAWLGREVEVKLGKLVFSHSTPLPIALLGPWSVGVRRLWDTTPPALLPQSEGPRGPVACRRSLPYHPAQSQTILHAKPYQSLSRFRVVRLKVLHN